MIPRIAIIDRNTLEAAGLKNILCDIVPQATVSIYPTVAHLLRDSDEEMPFVHFFVTSQALISKADFFLLHQRKTIVLTSQTPKHPLVAHFRTLRTSMDEHELVKAILTLHHQGHPIPNTTPSPVQAILSERETEVLALVARGLINKEIADRLCISLPTVISHRKNICEKLNLRTVSSLTIYAVTHGIAAIEDI